MRRLCAAALTLGLGGLGAACGPTRLTETQRSAITDSVEQVVHRTLDAVNRRDAAGFLSAYEEDAVMAYNGVIYSTKDSYRAALDSVWQAVSGVETRPMTLRTMVLGPDEAVTMVPFAVTLTGKSGRQATAGGVYTMLLQRRQGAWRILRSHESEEHLDQMLRQVMPAPM
ncbi:MAG TPA: SgcJ/EcaC family oxidoreductase [Gemmatimonadales bacterium]|nr:SgcJ/EcaC family oxidoreductase [Gemmatimonadales bacterium]